MCTTINNKNSKSRMLASTTTVPRNPYHQQQRKLQLLRWFRKVNVFVAIPLWFLGTMQLHLLREVLLSTTTRTTAQVPPLPLLPLSPPPDESKVVLSSSSSSSLRSMSAQHQQQQQQQRNQPSPPPVVPSAKTTTTAARNNRRFPLYGTKEYKERCPYIDDEDDSNNKTCTIFAYMPHNSGEGISQFMATITTAYFQSLYYDCRLYIDYMSNNGSSSSIGVVVDLSQVFTSRNLPPPNFQCLQPQNCYEVTNSAPYQKQLTTLTPSSKWMMKTAAGAGGIPSSGIRNLGEDDRAVSSSSLLNFYNYRNLYFHSQPQHQKEIDPSLVPFTKFNIDDGMACAHRKIYTLSPKASQYVPHLQEILPQLQDPESFVVSIFIRTGQTELTRKKEQQQQQDDQDEERRRRRRRKQKDDEGSKVSRKRSRRRKIKNIHLDDEGTIMEADELKNEIREHIMNKSTSIQCAQKLSSEQIDDQYDENSKIKRIVWMVITDTPLLGQVIQEQYNGTHASIITTTSSNETTIRKRRLLPRFVYTTQTSGVHSAPDNVADSNSTKQVAESIIDWYLLGESDLIIKSGRGISFGQTAALRTARPIIDGGSKNCQQLIHYLSEEKLN